jgi:hypothetical protein
MRSNGPVATKELAMTGRECTRDVAALCAIIITKHDAATGNSARVSLQLTSGNLIDGNPPGTGPMTAIPRSANH